MSLDVWFQRDIKHTLLALNQTSLDTVARIAALSADRHEAQIYRAGYGDALRAVAIAFGIATPATPPKPLTENLRLPQDWTEVEHDDELSGE